MIYLISKSPSACAVFHLCVVIQEDALIPQNVQPSSFAVTICLVDFYNSVAQKEPLDMVAVITFLPAPAATVSSWKMEPNVHPHLDEENLTWNLTCDN